MEISIKWNVCRICMEEESRNVVLSPIFEEPTLPNKIFLCSGIELKKTDNLPNKICERCLSFLKYAIKFRITCQKTTEYLNHIILKAQKASNIFKLSKAITEAEVTFDNIDFLEKLSVGVDGIIDNSKTQYIESRDIHCVMQDVEDVHVAEDNGSVKSIELDKMSAHDVAPGENSQSQRDQLPPDDVSVIFSELDENDRYYQQSYMPGNEIKRELHEKALEESDLKSLDETMSQINYFIKRVDKKPEQYIKEENKPTIRKYIRRGKPVKSPIYICDICGNHFTKKCLLRFHMKIHRNEKNYMCEICSKRFNSPCNLSAHIRVHTGEKPFQCQFCGRKFADRSTQIKHERIHTNEKPYSCITCGKAFSLSTSLKAHEKMHTGEKPYKCDPCSKAFTLPHQLKAHLQTNMHRLLTSQDV